MKQHQFLDLIAASQTTIKQELLDKHPESKYQLLMLSRSFDLLKHYINQQQQTEKDRKLALEEYFHLPIQHHDAGIEHLCEQLRHHTEPQQLALLNRLNQADLSITHPKVVKHD